MYQGMICRNDEIARRREWKGNTLDFGKRWINPLLFLSSEKQEQSSAFDYSGTKSLNIFTYQPINLFCLLLEKHNENFLFFIK